MGNHELRMVESIREEYTEKKKSRVNELVEMDRKVKRPAEIFAYTFGTVGSLVLGTGMCLAMKVIGNLMIPGIIIGLAGIAMVTANYFLYQKILKGRKEKYGKEILALSNEILGAQQ